MRITGLASTDLFTGTEPQPRQVIRVTVAEPGEGPVAVTVTGPGVRTPEPATVTAGPQATSAGAVAAEVGIELAAPHGPWSRLRVTAIAEGRAGRATLDGEITAAEPGWTMWMVSHFHYDPVWWNTQGQFTESRLLLPDENGRLPDARTAFELVRLHLEEARRDPDYKFVLAELDYLKPHFDAHPQDRADLLGFIAGGRVEIVGGSYNEPNTNLTTAESTIRNAVYGLAYQREVLGADPQSAWMLDAFGFDPGYPGLMAAAGLTSSAWARGPFHQWGPRRSVGDNTRMQFASEFEWLSPDGRGLLTAYMPNHYGAGWATQAAPDAIHAALEMPVAEQRGRHGELFVRIPNDDVRIAARRERSLAIEEAREARGPLAHPPCDVREREPARSGSRPHGRKRELEGRDASPRLSEVAALPRLELGRARRVVRHDEVDRPVPEARPEPFAVLALADRRRALELRRAVADLFRGEREVMGTRLDGDGHAAAAGGPEGRQRVGRREMDDVDAAAVPLGEVEEERDRLVFRAPRPRVEPRRVRARIAAGRRSLGAGDRAGQLGVDEEDRSEPRELGHRDVEVLPADVRELVDSRRDEEALAPRQAFGEERRERARVRRHEAAPEGDVDGGLSGERGLLGRDGLGRRRDRHAVERHVADRRDAAGRRRARGRLESLPLRPAGLVHVDVRVDDARHQDRLAEVVNVRPSGVRVVPFDRDDRAVPHAQRGRPLPFGGQDAPAPEHAVGHRARLSRG